MEQYPRTSEPDDQSGQLRRDEKREREYEEMIQEAQIEREIEKWAPNIASSEDKRRDAEQVRM